jgi:hypothetical protein
MTSNGRLVLNRDAIKRASDIRTEFVPTPEWADGNADAGIFVRSLTGRERADWQSSTVSQTKRGTSVDFHESTVGLVVLGACDEFGNAIFGDNDKQWLLDKSSGCLERVSDAIMKLSGIGDEDVEALKKASKKTTIDASYSVSPDTSAARWPNSSTGSAAENSASGRSSTPLSLLETEASTSERA